ncbi:MAG: TldD protein [Dehalococcoidia bacterium]|nr:TldD protein [Dehalococcoidia bacterium]
MRQEMEEALRGNNADYLDLRIEKRNTSHVVYRGKEMEDIGRAGSQGGSVRALVKGGWGFVSFDDLSRLRDKVKLAIAQARMAGNEKSQIATLPPAVHLFDGDGGAGYRAVPLARKKALVEEYNQLLWSVPRIQTSNIGYGDVYKRVVFANSEGSYIEQERTDFVLRLAAIARDGADVQQAHLSVGSLGNFNAVTGLHRQVKEMAERAVQLLSAPKVTGGEFPVVLDPVLGGVFTHEAFGHLSESDFVYENDAVREIMVLGKKFGQPHLNIVDGAAVPGLRGSYKYDDEGVPATKSYLIRDGILVGRLHSRETAAKMGESPTGNARALDYHFPPIVRMTNTFIEPGKVSFQDMVGEIKEGIYARNWYGGTTSMEMFTFSAGEAYMIRNGKIAEMVRPVVLTGNVFTTLGLIDAIGNDLDMNQGGGCGKGAQSPLPVSNGSPHIRISRCLVGGR